MVWYYLVELVSSNDKSNICPISLVAAALSLSGCIGEAVESDDMGWVLLRPLSIHRARKISPHTHLYSRIARNFKTNPYQAQSTSISRPNSMYIPSFTTRIQVHQLERRRKPIMNTPQGRRAGALVMLGAAAVVATSRLMPSKNQTVIWGIGRELDKANLEADDVLKVREAIFRWVCGFWKSLLKG